MRCVSFDADKISDENIVDAVFNGHHELHVSEDCFSFRDEFVTGVVTIGDDVMGGFERLRADSADFEESVVDVVGFAVGNVDFSLRDSALSEHDSITTVILCGVSSSVGS